jgi:hypothetical protein
LNIPHAEPEQGVEQNPKRLHGKKLPEASVQHEETDDPDSGY